jgi:hypothetical protein
MKKVSLLFAIIILCFAVPCSAEYQWTNEVAEPIVDNLLVTLHTNNYELFIKDLDPKLKDTIPESKYQEMRSTYTSRFGEYISKKVITTETEITGNHHIIVYYNVKFSLEQDSLKLKVVFSQDESKTYVIGFWLFK